MRDSFCKTGDRKAGKAGSGTEWGREPGLDTGSAAETWMNIVLLDLLKLGISLVARSAQRPIEDDTHRRSL